ncbi:hypothetical protein EJ110_NYTH46947 [Nymphaea thermarum]|nr:hypothetical protein EJ110_NYTH46947 [Nymphaea thermarum]
MKASEDEFQKQRKERSNTMRVHGHPPPPRALEQASQFYGGTNLCPSNVKAPCKSSIQTLVVGLCLDYASQARVLRNEQSTSFYRVQMSHNRPEPMFEIGELVECNHRRKPRSSYQVPQLSWLVKTNSSPNFSFTIDWRLLTYC